MKKLTPGVFCVLATPLLEGGGVDSKSIQHTVARLIEQGAHGIVVLGSGGELPYLTLDEKKTAIDAAAEAAAGKASVIAGACAFGTDELLQTARHAEKQKLDGLLVPLPIYYKLKFPDVLAHFRRIAEEVSLPIIYYHFPEVTHFDLKADELARLFEIKGVAGIKESIFNLITIKKHIAALPKSALVFSGTTLMLRPVMRMGGCGCICPIPSLIPDKCVAFHDALKRGEKKKALELENEIFKILPIFADAPVSTDILRHVMLTAGEYGITIKMGGAPHAAMKEALRLLGHPITPLVKSPLPQLTEKQKRKVFNTLSRMGLIEPETKS